MWKNSFLWKALNKGLNDSHALYFILFNQLKVFLIHLCSANLCEKYTIISCCCLTRLCPIFCLLFENPAHVQGVRLCVRVCCAQVSPPPSSPASLPHMPAPSRPSSNPTRDYWFTHNLLFNIGEQTFQNLRNLSISVCLSQLVCAAAESSWRARSCSHSTVSVRSLSRERRAFHEGGWGGSNKRKCLKCLH